MKTLNPEVTEWFVPGDKFRNGLKQNPGFYFPQDIKLTVQGFPPPSSSPRSIILILKPTLSIFVLMVKINFMNIYENKYV